MVHGHYTETFFLALANVVIDKRYEIVISRVRCANMTTEL